MKKGVTTRTIHKVIGSLSAAALRRAVIATGHTWDNKTLLQMFATYNDKEISYFLNDKQVMKEDAKYFYFAGAAHERHKFLLDAKDFDNLDPVSEAQHIINTGLKK